MDTAETAATIATGRLGIFHGMTPYMASVTTNQMVGYLETDLTAQGAEVNVIDTANDFAELASHIEDVTVFGTGAIVLVSADPTQLENQLREAMEAGMPVFGVDSGYIDGMQVNATSDNHQMGQLIAAPKIFLRGEPTRAVDVATRSDIHHLLRQKSDEGARVLYVSSDLARAYLKGVALSLRQGLECLPVPSATVSHIGGGREAVCCQLLADVLDHEITVLGDTEFRVAQVLASLARRGTGTDLAEDGTVYRPRSQYRALYDAQYARYQRLYPALQGL